MEPSTTPEDSSRTIPTTPDPRQPLTSNATPSAKHHEQTVRAHADEDRCRPEHEERRQRTRLPLTRAGGHGDQDRRDTDRSAEHADHPGPGAATEAHVLQTDEDEQRSRGVTRDVRHPRVESPAEM